MKKVCLSNITLHGSTRCFDLNPPEKIITDAPICESGSLNIMQAGGNDAKLKIRLSKLSPFVVKIMIENARRGISVSLMLKWCAPPRGNVLENPGDL